MYFSDVSIHFCWSVHQRVLVLDNIPRNNNAVEGWNNRFTQITGTRHFIKIGILSTIFKKTEANKYGISEY